MLRLRHTLCAAFVASVSLVSASASSDVVTLTSSNFSSVVETESLILVKFFTPWCGHCKAFAPEYEQAATALKNKNVKLAQVDCDQDVELCQANEIHGYP
ncbi:hypothetical protein ONZ45_g19036 [Pleurotus djamor]|nr:hypothetical protein ONZ45_g19036 [Pleurotus djamor]